MKLMATLLLIFLLTGCNALLYSTTDTNGMVAAKTAGRVVQCVVTLCISEYSYAEEDARLERSMQYQRWYNSLSAEERQREHERDLVRMQAAGMILQGYALRGGPLGSFQQPAPYVPYQVPAFAPAPVPRSLPPISCSTTAVGGYAQTNCY